MAKRKCPEGQIDYGGFQCGCQKGMVLKKSTGKCIPKPKNMNKFQCGFCHYSFERNTDETFNIYDSEGIMRTEKGTARMGIDEGECPLHGDVNIIWVD